MITFLQVVHVHQQQALVHAHGLTSLAHSLAAVHVAVVVRETIEHSWVVFVVLVLVIVVVIVVSHKQGRQAKHDPAHHAPLLQMAQATQAQTERIGWAEHGACFAGLVVVIAVVVVIGVLIVQEERCK